MSPIEIGVASVILIVFLIYAGLYIPIALGLVSFLGVWIIRDNVDIAVALLSESIADTVAEQVFATVPLFALMGLIVSKAGLGKDVYEVANFLFYRIRGGLGIATVAAILCQAPLIIASWRPDRRTTKRRPSTRRAWCRTASVQRAGSRRTPSRSAARGGATGAARRVKACIGSACPVAWASTTPSSMSWVPTPLSTGLIATTDLPRATSAAPSAAVTHVLPTPVSVPVTQMTFMARRPAPR